MRDDHSSLLTKTESLLSLLLLVVIMFLHVMFLTHAGALWRDEVQILNISTAPTFSQQWQWNEHDTFPLLWQFTLRAWKFIGLGATDFGLRVLGCLAGLATVGMLWYCLRQFAVSPLVCLPLFAMNPTVLVYGDSIRGYGFGILWMLFMIARLKIMLREPTLRNIGLAALSVVLAVQSFYFSVILFVVLGPICLAVFAYRRAWQAALAMTVVGLFAALTMLPYLDLLQRQQQWFATVAIDAGVAWYTERFFDTLNEAGRFMSSVWTGASALAFAATFMFLLSRQHDREKENQRLFVMGLLIFGTAAYFAFLFWRRNVTQEWYYIALMTFLVVAIESGISDFVANQPAARWARLAFVVLLTITTFRSAWDAAHMRLTNVDLFAEQLNQRAQAGDFIVVNPWWQGVTFTRYYHGAAQWSTLPELGPLPIQRFDLFQRKMTEPNPPESVLQNIAATLQSGHRVWIVQRRFLVQSSDPSPGSDPMTRQMSSLVKSQAVRFEDVPAASNQAIHKYEDMNLLLAEGWR